VFSLHWPRNEVWNRKVTMRLRLAILVVIIVIIAGCGNKEETKPLTIEQVAMVKEFKKLPVSAQYALLANNLVHETIFNASKGQEIPTKVFEVLIMNGAQRASRKTASLVITSKPSSLSTNVTITDKNGNTFHENLTDNIDAIGFAQEVADTIGTEWKVKAIEHARATK